MGLITRREFSTLAAGAMLVRPVLAQAAEPLVLRVIPSTGEQMPPVGLGTSQVFANNDDETRNAAAKVIRTLVAAEGRLIDTASVYQDSELVIGEVLAATGLRDKVFIATKAEEPDEDEVRRSLSRLKVAKLDLLQLHNVNDRKQSLARFKDWKAQGICRYIGITSTYHGDFATVEAVLAREKPDFVQIDYSIDDREAEKRILPIAAEVKAAVLTALPFGRGRLFRAVRGKPVPDWAGSFAGSWAQFFLKFLIADSRITAVIPGTNDAAHMADNLGAQRGVLPDPAQRKRMAAFIDAL